MTAANTTTTPSRLVAVGANTTTTTPSRSNDNFNTPAGVGDRSVSMAVVRSARRSASHRRRAGAKMVMGVGGWGIGAKEESPMDLLRRLARAPRTSAAEEQHSASLVGMSPALRAVPIGESRLSSSRVSEGTAAETTGRYSRGGGSSAGGSFGPRTTSSTTAAARRSASSVLRPGESVPGDLTRDGDSLVFGDGEGDSELSLAAASRARRSDVDASGVGVGAGAAADVGLGRRDAALATSTPRRDVFAGLLPQSARRSGALSSRSSFAGAATTDASMASLRDASATRLAAFGRGHDEGREAALEKTLDVSIARDATGVAVSLLDELDEITRRSFFGNSGLLSVGGEEAGDTSLRSRATSEPAAEIPFVDFDDLPPDEDDGEPLPELSRDESISHLKNLSAARDASTREDDSISRSRRAGDDDDEEAGAGRDDSEEQATEEVEEALRTADASTTSAAGERSTSMAQDLSAPTAADVDDSTAAGETSLGAAEASTSQVVPPSESGLLSDVDEDDEDETSAASSDVEAGAGPTYLALMKRRSARRKKIRTSAYTGRAVPSLPTSLINQLYTALAAPSQQQQPTAAGAARKPKIKIDRQALEAVDDASFDFFGVFAQELLRQAERSGRGSTIHEADVVALLKAQGVITPRHPLTTLARRLLPRELSDLVTTSERLQPRSSGGGPGGAAASTSTAGARGGGGGGGGSAGTSRKRNSADGATTMAATTRRRRLGGDESATSSTSVAGGRRTAPTATVARTARPR